jgi:predicted N-acetyltransferase YhbS
MTLRHTLETDAPTIAALMRSAFHEYIGILDPPSGAHKETEESVRDKMKLGQWLIAEYDGQPAGCVFYEPRDTYVYLGRLAVPGEFRGRGIGGALTDAVEAETRAAGIPRIRLGTRLALPHLIAMYEKRGYCIIAYETHTGYSAPTYVTMEKTL